MFRLLAFAITGLSLRKKARREGLDRGQINELMDGYNRDLFDSAVSRACAQNSAFAEAIAKAPGDGGFWEWLDKFLDSEFGKFLLDLLMQLLIGLIGGAGIMGKIAKSGAKAVAALCLFFLAVGSARATDDPPPVVADPPPVMVVASESIDPRGVWSPWWDGRQWQPRWLKEGKPSAIPFDTPETSAVARRTSAPTVANTSARSPATAGSTAVSNTYTRTVGRTGATKCFMG